MNHLVSWPYALSTLLLFDPLDDLIFIEDYPAKGAVPEVRKTSRDEGLPHRPHRATDEAGYLADP